MRTAALFTTMVLLYPVAARGDEASKVALDKKALDILKAAAALFQDAKSFQCQADIETDITDGDKKQHLRVEATIHYQKPNRIALRSRSLPDRKVTVDAVCDGKTYSVYLQRLNQYVEATAPAGPDELGRQLTRLGVANTGLIAPNVINQNSYEALMDGVAECSYVGQESLTGTAVHHLKFIQPGLEWEVWVAAQGPPLVLKAATTTSSDELKTVTVETYKSWKFGETPAEGTFKFTAPAGAKKVEEFGTSG
jgi:hypothetical protein